MAGHPRPSALRLWALAGALHLLADALSSRFAATTPPYLLADHAGPLFKSIVDALAPGDRAAVLVTLSVLASAVNGAISAMLAVAFETARRRRRVLAWSLFVLWALGGALLMLIYLEPPWGVALGSLAAGLPRSWVVAWGLDRILPRPAVATAAGVQP